jgi:HEAT repeat protein
VHANLQACARASSENKGRFPRVTVRAFALHTKYKVAAFHMGLQALGQAAESAVPVIIQIYEAKLSPSSERWSSYALGAIGPAAKEAIPTLLRGATNANPQSRQNSLIALASMHTEPALVVAALTNAFRDEDADVRLWACNRFGLLGNEALEARSAAMPALEPLLQDSDPRVRREANAVHKKLDSNNGGNRN